MIDTIRGAELPPVASGVQEGIWVMGNGLVTVDVGADDAYLSVLLDVCRYGGVTLECDADLIEAGKLIKGMGFTRTGTATKEDGVVTIELL